MAEPRKRNPTVYGDTREELIAAALAEVQAELGPDVRLEADSGFPGVPVSPLHAEAAQGKALMASVTVREVTP